MPVGRDIQKFELFGLIPINAVFDEPLECLLPDLWPMAVLYNVGEVPAVIEGKSDGILLLEGMLMQIVEKIRDDFSRRVNPFG